jgi:hypothetical protein
MFNEIIIFNTFMLNEIFGRTSLTPKGLGLPYVGFSDFRQADVNAINFWIFKNFLRL